jgi:hypothetical protein
MRFIVILARPEFQPSADVNLAAACLFRAKK